MFQMPKIKLSIVQKNRRLSTLGLAILCPALLSACNHAAPNSGTTNSGAEMIKPAAPAGFARVEDSDAELIGVKKLALDKLPQFTSAFADRSPDQKFLIKAPFREGENEEHKWVIVDAIRKDEIDGHIERPSQTIKHLKVGQTITVNDYNIEDWAYLDKKGQQQGGWSVAVLRKREKQGQQ